jgi:SAM-dependent methyltransferase
VNSSLLHISERGRNPLRLFGWITNWLLSSFLSLVTLNEIYTQGKVKIINSTKLNASLTRQSADIDFISILSEFIQTDSRILEIGCGSGINLKLFQNLKGWNGSYLGIDVQYHTEWGNLKNYEIQFSQTDIFNFPIEMFKEYDIIISHSVLEHIKNDLNLISNLAVSDRSYQIHCVPGRTSPIAYPFHGFRNYNKYEINKIKNIYESNGFAFVAIESGNLITALKKAFSIRGKSVIKRNVFSPFVILVAIPQHKRVDKYSHAWGN